MTTTEIDKFLNNVFAPTLEIYMNHAVKDYIADMRIDYKELMAEFEKKSAQRNPIRQASDLLENFPMRLAEFEQKNEFCRKMNFRKERLRQLISRSSTDFFKGTYCKRKVSGTLNYHYYIKPGDFLARLLAYPYKTAAEQGIVVEYKNKVKEHGRK